MKRLLLTGVLLLVVALGATGGYFTGDYLDTPLATPSGNAAPIGDVSPGEPSLPVKTPVPNDLAPLQTGLDYKRRTFTVTPKDNPPVQLSIAVPVGWLQTRDPKAPGEVKFLDRLKERGVRVEAVEPATQTPEDARKQLVVNLQQSQAPENDLRIVNQTDDQIQGDDGEPRKVSTLTYTFIPNQTLRYVIVCWVAADGGDFTTVEMSITGLPQDAPGLAEVLQNATSSVRATG